MNSGQIYKSPAGREVILALYDRLLQRWPVPYETFEVPTSSGRTFVIASGYPDAPPLLLLHGSMANSAVWLGEIGIYAREHRVFCVDLPGEPGRSAEVRHELRDEIYTVWLSEVLDGLGLAKTTLLGMSLGGWFALKFAAAYPRRVERLVLLCPAGVTPQRISFTLRVLPLLFLGEKGRDRAVRIVYGSQPVYEEAVAYTKLIGAHFIPRQNIPLLPDRALRQLDMPTLLIAGEQDALLPSRKTAARLQRLLPHLTAEIRPGVGHVLTGLAERVLEFTRVLVMSTQNRNVPYLPK